MAGPSSHSGFSTRTGGRSWLAPAAAGVGICALLAALSLVLLPTRDSEHDAHPHASNSVDEPEDNRLQVHSHHAEPLGEEAYKDAPADVVLWGDLARALVVRKGSTYQTTFLPPVLALDGKTISIIGHVTPLTEKDTPGKQFLLSDHAFLCDECEPPTPTELVEVNTKDFVVAKGGVATVRGQFEVVKDDPKGLAYRLNEAIVLKQRAH